MGILFCKRGQNIVKINGKHYQKMITDVLLFQLDGMDLQDAWLDRTVDEPLI